MLVPLGGLPTRGRACDRWLANGRPGNREVLRTGSGTGKSRHAGKRRTWILADPRVGPL